MGMFEDELQEIIDKAQVKLKMITGLKIHKGSWCVVRKCLFCQKGDCRDCAVYHAASHEGDDDKG